MSEPSPGGYAFWQALVRGLLRLARGLPEVSGLEWVPRSGGLIVAVNHLSWLDPPLIGTTLYPRRVPHFWGKEELFRAPVFGAWLRGVGCIPLNRRRGDLQAVREALCVLEAGGCMVVFPEGTRSRTGKPGRPKAGVGLLASRSGAGVVPARVRRTERLFGGPLQVRFGEPLRYEGPDDAEGYRAFAGRVMEGILKL